MNRDGMIQRLIQYEIDRLERGRSSLWLIEALERGFQGFRNMPDRELQREMRQRGLKADSEDIAESEDESDDTDPHDDVEVRSMLRQFAAVTDPFPAG